MSRTTNPPLSVNQVLEIVPSDDSWVNDGFTAIVRAIKQPSPNAQKKCWKCTLADTTGGGTILMTIWAAPKFGEGDQIDVTGQGIKRKEYNGQAEVSVGQKTEIHVVGKRIPDQEPARVPGQSGPAAQPLGDFHKAMKRQALLYLHCLDYAQQIAAKHKSGTGFEVTPEQRQACVSSLYIEANRQGLASVVPAFGAAPASAHSQRITPPSANSAIRTALTTDREAANLIDGGSEDVPF